MSGTNSESEGYVDSDERQDLVADVYRVKFGQTGEQPRGWADAFKRVDRKLQKIFVDTFGVVADTLGGVRGLIGGIIKGVKGTAELPDAWAKKIRNARGRADAAEDQAQAQIEDSRMPTQSFSPPGGDLTVLLASLHARGVPATARQLKDGNWVVVVAKPEDVPTAFEAGERAITVTQIFPLDRPHDGQLYQPTTLPLLGNIAGDLAADADAEVRTGAESENPSPPPAKPKRRRKKGS